ncbi:MAG: MerR family transcriptional regulator [Sedimentisphaerales bacterium]|nr:MerR family transcriptional regulator [Sedimentisphaerales bacterium]MBN2843225.1 MerR family transcriptional regulator [Sedimentisphaerales bacterium]
MNHKTKFCDSYSARSAGLLTIGQTAKECGITVQSIQYYIMCGLLEPAAITQTRRRLFDQNNIKRIILIKKLNGSGYPLREIRHIFLKKNMAVNPEE